MTQIQADAELARKIAEANGPIEIVDATGTVIASCTPIKFPHSPYSREEVEAARQQCRETGGKPLAEFLAKLKEPQP